MHIVYIHTEVRNSRGLSMMCLSAMSYLPRQRILVLRNVLKGSVIFNSIFGGRYDISYNIIASLT